MYKTKVSDYKSVNAKGVANYIKENKSEIDFYLNRKDVESFLVNNYSLARLKRIAVCLENAFKDLRKD